MAFVRKQGVRLIIYLDDILIVNESREGASADLEMVMRLLQELGFIINKEKSILGPTQKIEFLGILINSIRLWLNSALRLRVRHFVMSYWPEVTWYPSVRPNAMWILQLFLH